MYKGRIARFDAPGHIRDRDGDPARVAPGQILIRVTRPISAVQTCTPGMHIRTRAWAVSCHRAGHEMVGTSKRWATVSPRTPTVRRWPSAPAWCSPTSSAATPAATAWPAGATRA